MNPVTDPSNDPKVAIDTPLVPANCRAFVLFGATGDLARRMLWPSLYALDCDRLLPAGFQIIGAATSQLSDEQFRGRIKDAILQSANAELFDEGAFATFAARVRYFAVDVTAPGGLEPIRAALATSDATSNCGIIFYLATGPQLFSQICLALRDSAMVDQYSRVVIEKPIGSDTASANRTNEAIAAAFKEDQVFRIDHYLGKEAVQNLIALRFANSIFEPLWNANAIEQVQITVAETVGVDGRWPFYDATGALRDMVQSHLLQLLCLVAMEPPASFTPSAVRNEKVKVLWSLRPISGANVAAHAVAGQYSAGVADGQAVNGYLGESGASAASNTETFIALRVDIDNWRWAGVPFYLRTGKRMQKRQSEIAIQFKPAPYNIFAGIGASLAPNMLLIKLQPDEEITLTLMHKKPGLHEVQLGKVGLNLSLDGAFGPARRRIAYERMLVDVLRKNSALFVRRDEVEAAWKWIDGIIEGWRATGQTPKSYDAGSWGPTAATELLARHGHAWHE